MNNKEVVNHIKNWLINYSESAKTNGFVVGISGGIDSAVTSTLCAETGLKVLLVNMPIHQNEKEYQRALEHINYVTSNYSNTSSIEVNLSSSFDTLKKSLPTNTEQDLLAMANTRARLRMSTLFAIAQSNRCLVAGTGNKVEDFGVGFFTKYGDGGVDLSPIADLYKSEVFKLAAYLNVPTSIQEAKPTDGLWGDDRNDEDQLGATYDELEWAMEYLKQGKEESLSVREKEVIDIYNRFHNQNKHKMIEIPVCKIPTSIK